MKIKTEWLKFLIGWLLILIIRLIPFRPPNVEPVMATIMPFSKKYSLIAIFLFSFLGMIVFDVTVSNFGAWTLFTATAYGLLGIWAYFFFQRRKGSIKNYLYFSIIGTIAYDLITGLTIGPIFFGQPLIAAALGQIPFTINHLIGNIVFAITFSPLIERWIVSNESLEVSLFPGKI